MSDIPKELQGRVKIVHADADQCIVCGIVALKDGSKDDLVSKLCVLFLIGALGDSVGLCLPHAEVMADFVPLVLKRREAMGAPS